MSLFLIIEVVPQDLAFPRGSQELLLLICIWFCFSLGLGSL